ncbi:MAG: hypothetical protein JSS57_09475 [Proteobacteria bacterium]|nr:hypothetical protein [Pseudomonadota bacterium]
MTQNLVSLDLSAEALATLDQALTTIEQIFAPFISLSADEMRSLSKMGDKSEQFCRQTALVLEHNRDILPPSFSVAEVQRDFAAFDALRPRLLRLREVVAKAEDTTTALGSDILVAMLEGYALMKMFGKGEGLETLRKAMLVRNPGRRAKPAEATA